MIYLKQTKILLDKFPVIDCYPFNLKILQNTEQISFDKDITFFIGENGSGKSTLIKALALRCGIHIWDNETNLRYEPNPYENDLYKAINVQWEKEPVPGSFFSSRIFSDFSRNLEEWAVNDAKMLNYFGGKSLITQSHGQSLMSYFKSRYKIKGIYFIDEPETSLSPASLIELLNLLSKFGSKGNAQFIIATHSPFLLACPHAKIYNFNSSTIEPIEYKDTAYYKLYKQFMNHPETFIKSQEDRN